MLNDALNQPVVVTEDGRSRQIWKHELGIRQLVNKFAVAEVQAIKSCSSWMLERERLVAAVPPPSGHPLALPTRR